MFGSEIADRTLKDSHREAADKKTSRHFINITLRQIPQVANRW